MTSSTTATAAMDDDVARVAAALPHLDIADVPEARRVNDALLAPLHAALSYEGVTVERVAVPSEDGAADASIRMMRSAGVPGATPVLLAMHGGGFLLGRSEDFDYFCLEVVRRLGITVANLDYRLAPEAVFPAAVEDCWAALRFLHAEAEALGVDPSRIAVGGSSAGGCLAAATALRARDEHVRDAAGPTVAFQLLLSPATDDRWRADAPSDGVPFDGDGRSDLVWQAYLGPGRGGPSDPDLSPYAAPARAEDLSGLPPTYIAAMASDPIRDANIEYARRLLGAGVRVELHCHPGTFHGSAELAPQAASSARVVDGLVDALARGLQVTAVPA